MKTVGLRSIVLYILLFAFLGGIGWLVVNLFIQGSQWAMQPYNRHIYIDGSMGDVEDRDGNILAYTEDGSRKYSDSETARRALLHTVGDTEGYISTSVQYTLQNKLTGFNPVFGLNRTIFSSLGSTVKLTLDSNACTAAYNAMEGHNGGAIFYNYKNGNILCKVSAPSYDPLNVPENIDSDPAYKGAYLDNTLSGSFTPGSIFKLVTSFAAMEKWPDTWTGLTYSCAESEDIGGSNITCLGYHGDQDMQAALGNSCNLYFAKLANDIGAADLQKSAGKLGFNKPLDFSSIEIAESECNLSGTNANQLGWAGVGQYTVLVNPYQMMTVMGAVANGGSYVQPRLTEDGGLFGGLGSSGGISLMSQAQANNLKTMMRSTVSGYYGDWLFPDGLNVCAKTGTGEVGESREPNCWMVGFCDSDSYPIAFAVLVEESNNSLGAAGGVVNAVLSELIS